MSLLAGPRRRQIISSNPQGRNFNDNWQQFGKKLMSKSGWQEGDGLGPDRDGPRESLAMNFKDDNRGLGCTLKHEQNWLAHNDDFNSLLLVLNQQHGTAATSSISALQTPEKPLSLEEKSKNSGGRIHYHKFTRGKDLSSRSTSDIASIFGGKLPSAHTNKLEKMNDEMLDDQREVRVSGLQTITSQESVHDYFSNKMALLKSKQRKADFKDHEVRQYVDPEPVIVEIRKNDDLMSDTGVLLSKKHKMKRRGRETALDEQVSDKQPVQEFPVSTPETSNKRKKRCHSKDVVIAKNGEHFTSPDVIESACLDQSEISVCNSKKRKRKLAEPLLDDTSMVNEILHEKPKKKNSVTPTEVSLIDCNLNYEPEVQEAIEISESVSKRKKKVMKSTKVAVEEKLITMQVFQSRVDGSVVVTEENDKKTSVAQSTDNGELLTTTTSTLSFNRTNFSLSMRGIRAKLQKLSEQEKSQMFPGSNLFDISGYGDHHFF